MCELYELGGWERGADKLIEGRGRCSGELLWEGGWGLYSICIAWAQLASILVG